MPWKDKSKYRTEAYQENMRNYQKDWHERNKAQRLAHMHERKESLRVFYSQLKENLACTQCGESHPATLQFHHRDPRQAKKDFNLSAAVRDGYSVERIKSEVAKCTVLCANCHAKLHYEWDRKNKEAFQGGLVGQFQEIEQTLTVSQEEKFVYVMGNQDVSNEVEIYESSPDENTICAIQ